MTGSSVFSNLKLRASVGETGNDGIGNYARISSPSSQDVVFDDTRVVGSSPGGSFFGEVSCIQMYGRALTPPMMNAISRKCFVNETHPLSSPCPLNFKLIGSDCFKLSTEPLSFTEAEIKCTSHPDDSYHMKLAFPENIQIQETLAYMAKSKLNISKLWVGLDSRSG